MHLTPDSKIRVVRALQLDYNSARRVSELTKILYEESGTSARSLPQHTAKAVKAKQEAEAAMHEYAALEAERTRRQAVRDVERGFEQVVSQRVMSRLRDEDTKDLNEIMRRTNIDSDTKQWAQKTYDERYGTGVNGGPMQRHPNEDRYGAARAEVEAQVRAEMEAAKQNLLAYGNGRVKGG